MKTKSFFLAYCLSLVVSVSCAQKSKPVTKPLPGTAQPAKTSSVKSTNPAVVSSKQPVQKTPATSQSTSTPSAAAKPAIQDVKKTPTVIEERTTRTESVIEVSPVAAPDSEIKKP